MIRINEKTSTHLISPRKTNDYEDFKISHEHGVERTVLLCQHRNAYTSTLDFSPKNRVQIHDE